MKKILLVDDNRELRELVAATLDKKSTIILEAFDGAHAVEVARKERPDMVVMDIEMPGNMDGVEATRAIKTSDQGKNCVVIVLSGIKNPKRIEACLNAGASDYLIKPFSPLELVKKIEAFCAA